MQYAALIPGQESVKVEDDCVNVDVDVAVTSDRTKEELRNNLPRSERRSKTGEETAY